MHGPECIPILIPRSPVSGPSELSSSFVTNLNDCIQLWANLAIAKACFLFGVGRPHTATNGQYHCQRQAQQLTGQGTTRSLTVAVSNRLDLREKARKHKIRNISGELTVKHKRNQWKYSTLKTPRRLAISSNAWYTVCRRTNTCEGSLVELQAVKSVGFGCQYHAQHASEDNIIYCTYWQCRQRTLHEEEQFHQSRVNKISYDANSNPRLTCAVREQVCDWLPF